jgi:hypothetical protein
MKRIDVDYDCLYFITQLSMRDMETSQSDGHSEGKHQLTNKEDFGVSTPSRQPLGVASSIIIQ